MTDGPDTPNGRRAFHLNAEGVARLFAASIPTGPEARRRLRGMRATYPRTVRCPEMYEPVESPVANLLHPKTRNNPLLKYPRVDLTNPSARLRISHTF